MTRQLRHNDVVMERTNRGYSFYGRVWKRLDDRFVVVIDCGKYVTIYHQDELKLTDYTGNWKWQHEPWNDRGNPARWNPMPNLRKLKNYARRYNCTLEPHTNVIGDLDPRQLHAVFADHAYDSNKTTRTDWCEKQFSNGDWTCASECQYGYAGMYYFRRDEDAVLFKMKWG